MTSYSPDTLAIRILDKDYYIYCPEDERRNVETAARYVDSKMREIRFSGRVVGAERIAVMAALNIAHELLNKRYEDRENADNKVQVRALLDKVDQALAGQQDDAPKE